MNPPFSRRQTKKVHNLSPAIIAAAGLLTVAFLLPSPQATAKVSKSKKNQPSSTQQNVGTVTTAPSAIQFYASPNSGIIDPIAPSQTAQGTTDPLQPNNRYTNNPMIATDSSGQVTITTGMAQGDPPNNLNTTAASATPAIGTVAYNGALPTIDPQILRQGLSSISQPLIQNLWNPPASPQPSPYATDNFSPKLTKILTVLGFSLVFAGLVLRRLGRQAIPATERLAARRSLTLASTNR